MRTLSLVVLLIFVVSSSACLGQSVVPSISFGGGSSTYFGELSPYDTPFRSVFSPAVRWNVSASYEYPINAHLGTRIGFTYARIFGDDNLLENVPGKELNYIRNLHVRNDLQELSARVVYYPGQAPRQFTRRKSWVPYVAAGISVFHHNPQARDVRPTADEPSDWVDLRPLMTEGQPAPYPSFSATIPLSVGVKYRLGQYIDLSFELSYQYAFTDYLDDVSGGVDAGNGSALANRSLESVAAYSGKDRTDWLFNYLNNNGYAVQDAADIPFQFPDGIPPLDTPGAMRGNPNINDGYLLTRISLVFYLEPAIKCPHIR